MEKTKIREVIVVEGRDDEAAVLRAVDAVTIPTSGYGISEKTIELIDNAYKTVGIIIFTDPDHAGLCIRRKLKGLFPDAKEAFLTSTEAEKKGDIGIENATPESIINALKRANVNIRTEQKDLPDSSDMFRLGLSGSKEAAQRRERLGEILGIGSGNAASFLKKLQRFGIDKEELYKACQKL